MTLYRFHCLHKRLSEPNSFLTWSSPSTVLPALLLPCSEQFQRQEHQKNKDISKYKQITPRSHGLVKVIISYLFKTENLPLSCNLQLSYSHSVNCRKHWLQERFSASACKRQPHMEQQSKTVANIRKLAKVRALGRVKEGGNNPQIIP